jgi:hypothetical protein
VVVGDLNVVGLGEPAEVSGVVELLGLPFCDECVSKLLHSGTCERLSRAKLQRLAVLNRDATNLQVSSPGGRCRGVF